MGGSRGEWRTTTHEWAQDVDAVHLDLVRRSPQAYAPGGALHLVLEVLAYAVDEAERVDAPHAVATLHADGSILLSDLGRGTDTRVDDDGAVVRKPVMATADVRFFDDPAAPLLADGYPRRGVSVGAGLDVDRLRWLVATVEALPVDVLDDRGRPGPRDASRAGHPEG